MRPHALHIPAFKPFRPSALAHGAIESPPAPSACSFGEDGIPDSQQKGLCDLLNTRGSPKRCSWQSFPNVPHLGCTDVNTKSACLNWFDQQ